MTRSVRQLRLANERLAQADVRRETSARARTDSARPGGSVEAAAFRIVSVQDDWLTCKKLVHGVEAASTTLVAKDFCQQREAVWNGYTYSYSGTGSQLRISTKVADNGVESQAMTREFVAGDRVLAVRVPSGTDTWNGDDELFWIAVTPRDFAKVAT